MPVISIFFGIAIFANTSRGTSTRSIRPRKGSFDFDGNQIVGNITSRNALSLIQQWAVLNRAALNTNWSKIQSGQPLDRIPPLE